MSILRTGKAASLLTSNRRSSQAHITQSMPCPACPCKEGLPGNHLPLVDNDKRWSKLSANSTQTISSLHIIKIRGDWFLACRRSLEIKGEAWHTASAFEFRVVWYQGASSPIEVKRLQGSHFSLSLFLFLFNIHIM